MLWVVYGIVGLMYGGALVMCVIAILFMYVWFFSDLLMRKKRAVDSHEEE